MVSIGGCDDDDMEDEDEDEEEEDDDEVDDEDDTAEAAMAVAVGFVEVMVGLADEGSILSADVLLSTVLVSESAVDFSQCGTDLQFRCELLWFYPFRQKDFVHSCSE